MTYYDKYPKCVGCPVKEYCGLAVGCFKLCCSYDNSNQSSSEKEGVLPV